MEELCKREEKAVILAISREFLEERLGIEANPAYVRQFTAHIRQFERWVNAQERGLQYGARQIKSQQATYH